MLASLIRHLGGDFQLAEDAVQDAVPARPGAWLTVAARRKAIDRLRRDRALADRVRLLERLMDLDAGGPGGPGEPGTWPSRLPRSATIACA